MKRTKKRKVKESLAVSFRLHSEAINVYKRTGLTPNQLEENLLCDCGKFAVYHKCGSCLIKLHEQNRK